MALPKCNRCGERHGARELCADLSAVDGAGRRESAAEQSNPRPGEKPAQAREGVMPDAAQRSTGDVASDKSQAVDTCPTCGQRLRLTAEQIRARNAERQRRYRRKQKDADDGAKTS